MLKTTAVKTTLFWRLWAYSLPHKARFLVAFMLLAVSVAAEMTIPWLAKIIVDDVIVPQHFEWQYLGWLIAAVMGSYVIAAIFSYWQAITFRHSALLVINDIRRNLFSHILNYPIRVFDKQPAGVLVSYITNDTESMREMFVSTIPTIIQGGLRISAIFIAIAMLDWRLMLLSLVLIPTLLFTMHLYRKISMPVFNGVREQISYINGRLNESLQGMALIQAFRQQAAFRNKFEQENQRWFAFRSKSIGIDSLMLIPLTRLVSTLTAAGIVAWFATGSLMTVIDVGTLYAFLNYIERFFDPFRQLSMELRKLQIATVSSKRIFELFDDKSESQSPLTTNVAIPQQCDIEFRNVNLSYEEGQPVLKDVSFVAKGGKFTAIVGHTGSGKSSIINVLMRFYQHQQGQVLVGGQPLVSIPELQLRKMVGLVSQDPTIFSGSVLDNIELSHAILNEDRAINAAKQVRADDFIQRLNGGYHHRPSIGGGSLSVGERQLLALARALSHNPQVFLLDEATANIDSETEEAVKIALDNIQDGRTVIIVAHRLSTVQNADQILVMNHGQIVQSGTHDALITQDGDYRDLYLAQQEQQQNEQLTTTFGLTSATLSSTL